VPTPWTPFGASKELPSSRAGILSQFVCVRSIHAESTRNLGRGFWRVVSSSGHRAVVELAFNKSPLFIAIRREAA
jgi:hypothetical protein